MISRTALLAFLCPLALGACTTADRPVVSEIANTTLRDADGKDVGSASIAWHGSGIVLNASVATLPPGPHGIHLHTTGKCDAPQFTSAGGHLNPSAHQHGTLNPAGPHLGDLPNIDVGADGTGTIEVTLPGLPGNVRPSLFDADGTAVVVHAGPDDYRTDPSGNSGGRIACGVLMAVGN